MALPSRPYDEDCFLTFQSKLHEYTVRPNKRDEQAPRPFVLRSKLEKWLKDPVEENAATLLEAVYNAWHQPTPPIKIGTIVENCLITFCILIELKLGELIYCFQRCGILDAKLPIKLSELEEDVLNSLMNYGMASADARARAPDLARSFDREQWKYCAVRFKMGNRQNYESRRIFPYIDRKLITEKGATANLYEVAIPDGFLDKSLKDMAPAPAPHSLFPDLGLVRASLAVSLPRAHQ
jgi:hypothetical protein